MAFLPSLPPVHVGFGAIAALPGELEARRIERPLLLTDPGLVKHGVVEKVLAALPRDLAVLVHDGIPENPTAQGVEEALEVYREHESGGIVAVGGGSVLDSGKALRVVAAQPVAINDLLYGNAAIGREVAPLITVPTTAGTGAELTPAGGIHPTPGALAVDLLSPRLKPDVAVCDPELALTLPPHLTAATGIDALAHCIEGFLSPVENPPIEAAALDGIRRVTLHLERAVGDGADREAREQMTIAAMEGGMAIYLGLGSIHSIAHALGDGNAHHGMLVALATPVVLRSLRGHADTKLRRIRDAMGLSTGSDPANAIAGFIRRVGLPAVAGDAGYSNDAPLEQLALAASKSVFHLTAARRPSADELAQMIAEVLDRAPGAAAS